MAKKILIVEDDATSIALVKAGLEKKGYKVILARDGDVGLERVQDEKPDLIILDIEMPRMNGYTFMNQLSQMEDAKGTPVIILTTHEEMQPIFEVKGVKGFFVKPAEFDKIVNKDILVSRPKPLDLKIHNIIDLNNIRTLEDYSDWLKNNIQYQHDGLKDTWSYPVKTLSKAKGDCEDFSFLNMYVLKMLGYQPRFIAVQRPGKAHAICIFKHNGRYYWFDNAKLHKSNSESLQNFSQLITQRYNYKQVLELDLDTNSWQIIFQRS